MDDFVKTTLRTMVPGGFSCSCCNDFRSFSRHKVSHGAILNKLRRARLKRQDKKTIFKEYKDE